MEVVQSEPLMVWLTIEEEGDIYGTKIYGKSMVGADDGRTAFGTV